jgi:hypothetical protein
MAMDEIERKARQLTANKMGLLNDVKGERLPDELWKQCEREARVYHFEIARAEALGTLLGMVDVVILAHDNAVALRMSEKIELLRAARAAHTEADKAYRNARLAQ